MSIPLPGPAMTPKQMQHLQLMQIQQQQRILAQTPRPPGLDQTPQQGNQPIRPPLTRPMIRPPGSVMHKRPILIPNSTKTQQGSLLPPQNTFMPRLKHGYTSLVTPNSPKQKSSITRKRPTRFRDENESGDETESDYHSIDDSEESEGRVKRVRSGPVTETPIIEQPKIIRPFEMKPKRQLHTTKHDYEKIHLAQMDSVASVPEVLVPIQLDFDVDHYKIQDSFSWNLNEMMISTEKFAEYLCNDVDINPSVYAGIISRSMKTQIEEYKRFFQVADIPVEEDTRTVINLDITVGKVHLRDRFEWDLAGDLTPEEFSRLLVNDLALGGEFRSLIANSIREQIYKVRLGGEQEPTFAIEKPTRSEEEAKGWSPFIDCGDRVFDDEERIEQDRRQRLLRRQQRLDQNQRKRGLFMESQFLPPTHMSLHQPHIQSLPEELRNSWRCAHCLCHVTKTHGIMDGPTGSQTLCLVCGLYNAKQGNLPHHRLQMFKN